MCLQTAYKMDTINQLNHFADEETEAQGVSAMCPTSRPLSVGGIQSGSRTCGLNHDTNHLL